MESDINGIHFGRRDFIRTAALASVAATIPGSGLAAQNEFNGRIQKS